MCSKKKDLRTTDYTDLHVAHNHYELYWEYLPTYLTYKDMIKMLCTNKNDDLLIRKLRIKQSQSKL